MTMAAAGVAKLIEEMGELHQVLGKKLAWWDTDEPHWDGSVLNERMEDEMGDVLAAIWFVADQLGLNKVRIGARERAKTMLFGDWEDMLDNNDHGVDGRVITPELAAALVRWRERGYHDGLHPHEVWAEANDLLKSAIDRWRR